MIKSVSDLPRDIQDTIDGRDIIVFDGVCVLCSRFFRFVLNHDKDANFYFVTAQSPLGTRIYQALNLPTDEYETNLVFRDGEIFTKLDAFNAVIAKIGGGWRILSLNKFLPKPVRDFLYDRIARNRYAIFGKTQTCLIPDEALRHRFIQGGYEL